MSQDRSEYHLREHSRLARIPLDAVERDRS